MANSTITPQQAPVMATYYVPAYQRLRMHFRGEDLALLCFVNPVSSKVREHLEYVGALPSVEHTAPCFAEIWQIPTSQLTAKLLTEQAFDQRVADTMEFGVGGVSSKAGIILNSTSGDFRSRLLEESQFSNRKR